MGGYYARHDGESEAIAFAIEDHYKPRFAGDVLPRNDVGVVVALADKLETLVGHVRHRSDANGRQGPVCVAPAGAGCRPNADGTDARTRLSKVVELATDGFQHLAVDEG